MENDGLASPEIPTPVGRAALDMADELILRRLIWLAHGPCHFHALYGDDGEMQCNSCMIDFKRDSPGHIENKLFNLAIARFAHVEPVKVDGAAMVGEAKP